MRSSSAALQSFLLSRQPCFRADLFTVTLLGGTVYRWTDFDRPVVASGNTFLNQGPLLQRSRLGVKNTVEIPELVLKLLALDTDFVGGIGIKQQLHDGYFDGALVQLDRCAMPTAGDTSLGTPTLFTGILSLAKVTAIGGELTIKGSNRTFNQNVPRNCYQTSCLHTFCDSQCTLTAGTFSLANTVGSGSTASIIKWGSVPASPGIYTRGKITFTSGPASGQIRTVKVASSSGIALAYPLYVAPNTGDSVIVLEGCDKNINTGSGQSCADRSNQQHYRGFPYIPTGETAI